MRKLEEGMGKGKVDFKGNQTGRTVQHQYMNKTDHFCTLKARKASDDETQEPQ